MAKINFALLGALAVLLVVAGCQQKESAGYRELLESDFGIGVVFGMSQTQVHEALGQPSTSTERQGGASVEDYYFPEGVDSLTDETSYASFTYHYGTLVRVGNRYSPADVKQATPPFFVEPLPGVKLGARRSAFVDGLGPVEKAGTGETWRYSGAEGEMVTVKAWFVDVAAVGDTQCSQVSVTFSPLVEHSRGELSKGKK